MVNLLDNLKALLPPQSGNSMDHDWHSVELALGLSLPSDYKEFIAQWHGGGLSEFFWFFLPNTEYESVRYPEAAQAFVNAYAQLKSSYPDKYAMPMLPAKGSFFPFAISDNGDYLGWIVDGNADTWQVALLSDEEGTPEKTGKTFAEFMVDLVEGKLNLDGLPKSFSVEKVYFTP